MIWRFGSLAIVAGLVSAGLAAEPEAVRQALRVILQVKAEGQGNAAAAKAWKELVANSDRALFPTLEAFKQASPTAANWLRSAVDGILQAEAKAGRQPSLEQLAKFVQDATQKPEARRIAYELLFARDRAKAESLLPGLTNDPSPDLRRDAIESEVNKAESLTEEAAKLTRLKKLFELTRDKDQAVELAEKLGKLKAAPNLTTHFNYITEWHVIGPFDSTMGVGFTRTYPPEKSVQLGEELTGKGNAKLTWQYAQSEDTYGLIDLNKVLTKFKDAVAYAAATILSEQEQPAEIRVASQNSIQIYLNGEKVFEREEYHHGSPMDGHIARVTLKKGPNTVVVKVLQNDQKEAWAQVWAFSARICDSTGGAIKLQQLLTREGKTETIPLGQIKPLPPQDNKEDK